MTRVDDLRRTIEETIPNMTPARAQELARGLLEPGAAKEQMAKTAADMIDWSQRNRERFGDVVRREIHDQLKQLGIATQEDLDALRKRVRVLERRAGMTASGRSRAQRSSTAKPAAKKPSAAKRSTATSPAEPSG
jgi:polyhydroxyalkanoate synthesis regulator phasin